MITLTLPYPPGKNRIHRRVGRLTLLSREAREYQTLVYARVHSQLAGRDDWPLAGPVAVRVAIYRPQRRGDLDGRLPWLIDCLNGLAWTDDREIVHIEADRYDDRTNPRVEVTVWEYADAALPRVLQGAHTTRGGEEARRACCMRRHDE